MEGKLLILFLFVILNNAYGSPSALPGSSSKTGSDKPSLGKQNISRRNDDEPYVSPEGNGNNYENNYQGNSGLFERPLTVGDTFTPSELLPVTQKLIQKIEHPRQGKGIVSGAKSPEDLADKLFAAFFFSRKRIIKLNEQDISGLDALQALALSGEVTYLREHMNVPITEASDPVTMSYRGQTISINLEPKTSKYRLLTKKDSVQRRGAIKLAQKLWKKRHIIVNPGRRHHAAFKFSKKAEISRSKGVKSETGGGSKKQTTYNPGNKTFCHWRYECTDPVELDTCHLKTECNKNTTIVEFDGVPHLPDEHTQSMQQFRRMLGITLVDEEVEKILEKRYVKLKPPKGRPGPDSARLESLAEYFNNIIMNDYLKSTEPQNAMPIPVTEAITNDAEVAAADMYHEVHESSPSPIKDESGRRFYVTPTRSTLKPSNHKL